MDDLFLERDEQLAALDAALARATDRVGTTVLVPGEPGIGKTTLLRTWADRVRSRARVLRGACDDLAAPRMFGPIRDLATGPLAQALQAGAPRDVILDAALREIDDPLRPTVVILEDLQWADEATLDVARFLRRRLDTVSCVLVLSHRHELADGHPLHQFLGETVGPGVIRLELTGLSPEAVATLAGGLDAQAAAQLHAATGGNPFYVLELRDVGANHVPASVRDAVGARIRSLPTATRAALEQLAVEPGRLELQFVARLVPDGASALAEAERHGLVTVELGTVRFRHELTRRAILAALPGAAVAAAHTTLLEQLDPTTTDAARLVHHALGAGDAATVARVAPDAARQAVRAGAHRDAVTTFEHALRWPQQLTSQDRRTIRTEYAQQLLLANRLDDALAQAELAAADPLVAEDAGARGEALRVLAEARYWGLKSGAAVEAAEAAVATLAEVPGPGLADAAATLAFVRLMTNEFDAAIDAANTALDGEPTDGTRLRALTHRGTARVLAGDEGGTDDLATALRDATTPQVVVEACIGSTSAWFRLGRVEQGQEALRIGLETAAAHDLDTGVATLRMMRAGLDMARGDWHRAATDLHTVVGDGTGTGWGETVAMAFLGRIKARRGEPDAPALLERAWQIAAASGEIQRIGPVGAALLEWGWLTGRLDEVLDQVETAVKVAIRAGHGWYHGELRRYLAAAGHPVTDVEHLAEPWRRGVRGDALGAARDWDERGWPYEAALERLASGQRDQQLAGLAALDRLGATATATLARRQLRKAGVTGIPRGPQDASRSHPAGLTRRQAEVLDLLRTGATNGTIAATLQLSVRTVDSHVSAILHKLGVETREEAAQVASRFSD